MPSIVTAAAGLVVAVAAGRGLLRHHRRAIELDRESEAVMHQDTWAVVVPSDD
jgi:hypothetical protein